MEPQTNPTNATETEPYEEILFSQMQQESETPFVATGYSRIKVKREGKTVSVKLKIRSIPHEIMEDLRKATPKPPSKAVGKGREQVIVPDFSDETYQAKAQAHTTLMGQTVLGYGVDEKLMLDGRPAEKPEDKYKALLALGISSQQINEISGDIMKLTEWTEDEREKRL